MSDRKDDCISHPKPSSEWIILLVRSEESRVENWSTTDGARQGLPFLPFKYPRILCWICFFLFFFSAILVYSQSIVGQSNRRTVQQSLATIALSPQMLLLCCLEYPPSFQGRLYHRSNVLKKWYQTSEAIEGCGYDQFEGEIQPIWTTSSGNQTTTRDPAHSSWESSPGRLEPRWINQSFAPPSSVAHHGRPAILSAANEQAVELLLTKVKPEKWEFMLANCG